MAYPLTSYKFLQGILFLLNMLFHMQTSSSFSSTYNLTSPQLLQLVETQAFLFEMQTHSVTIYLLMLSPALLHGAPNDI